MGLKRRRKRSGKIKKGGLILPLLSTIEATGSLLGGASNMYRNYRTLQNNAKLLDELNKHNQTMNSIVAGKGFN